MEGSSGHSVAPGACSECHVHPLPDQSNTCQIPFPFINYLGERTNILKQKSLILDTYNEIREYKRLITCAKENAALEKHILM